MDGYSTWKLGDRVLCRYLNSKIYYEAKIISIDHVDGQERYGIHYQGWNSRHDEKILYSEALVRFKKYTTEEAEKAKTELKKAQQELYTSSTKKRKSTTSTPENKRLGDDSSRGSTPSISAESTKRQRMSKVAEIVPRMNRKPEEVQKIVIPDPLRKVLIDDENLINKSFLLPKIPTRYTVFDIIQEYRKTVNPNCEPQEYYIEYSGTDDALINPLSEMLDQSALGLMDYFEAAVGRILLYKAERPMFNDLVEKLSLEKDANSENTNNAGKKTTICFSKQFGLPHLLRLFVRFSEMLCYTHWTDRALDATIRHAQDFVMFLSKKHSEYYDVEEDYHIMSPDYQKRVWGNQS